MITTQDTLLILRESRLGRIPPALFSTELLKEKGLPVVVLEYGSLKEAQPFVTQAFPRIRLQGPWIRFFPKALQPTLLLSWVFIQCVFLLAIAGRPKLLVAHGASEQVLALLLSKIFWIPFVIHAHEVYEKKDLKGKLSRFLFRLEKWAFKSASFVIFPEPKRAEVYRERYQFEGPAFIAANTPRLVSQPQARDLRKAYHLPSDSLIMGYLGGIGPANQLELALQALSFHPKVFFLVWGWGEKAYLERLQSLAHVLGVSERFIYLGQLTENKLETLAGCDWSYCIYEPSLLRLKHAVHASNKFFEAMASGIPSLISSEMDFYRFNKEHSVGVCASSLTPEGISQAMKTLIENPSLRKNLGAHGRRVFENRFHYEHQFYKPLQAYQDLFAGYLEIWSFNEVYFPPQDLAKAA